MTKRKTKKKSTRKKSIHKKQSINYKLINSILAIIIVLILAIIFILYTTDSKKLKESKELSQKVEKTIKKELLKVEEISKEELDKYFEKVETKKDQFEEYTKDLYEEYIDKDHKIEQDDKNILIKKDENLKQKIDEEKKQENIKIPIKKVIVKDQPLAILTNKPKLAIVIDDVTTKSQLNKIKKIGYRVTPSFMPPTPGHPNSANISKDLDFYMIHFPLEASTFRAEEKNTLHITDSYERIEKRVSEIRQWYPNAKYTNNHTGSKFTSNTQAMDRLFKALVKYDFVFMDSRTSGKTVGKQMAKKYNMPYIVRNVFLDNEQDFAYIQNQLKKAIRIAKKNGQAIAICHPHSITLKVLRESKHLLKDLELVYVNQLSY